jgi:muramoyltetrapeptide carboxypeptidase
MTTEEAVRPPALQPGDLVMVLSPAGPAPPDRVAAGIELLRSWGLRPVPSPHAFDHHGYLAGSDAERVEDLNAAFADPAVRGIVVTRGGYGTQRLVDHLDIHAIRRDPKPLVGFSDITALQLALWQGARLATLHGPGAAWVADRTGEESAQSLHDALMTTEPVIIKQQPASATTPASRLGAAGLPGIASGYLLGGNLSLLVSSIGTRDFPDLRGAILLIEDVDEAPYRVDRMLTQLRRSGVLAEVAAMAVGQFVNCADQYSTDVADVIGERLGDLGVPVLGGLPIGHGNDQLTVPLGVPAMIDVAAATLTVSPAVR